MLVQAEVTDAQHSAVASNADVVSVPANLDAQPSAGQLSTVAAVLETLNIPTDWVTSGMTYRDILKGVVRFFLFAQRLNGMAGPRLFAASTLDMQLNSLNAANRQKLQDVFGSFNFSAAGVTGTTTIRRILKIAADQWTDRIAFGTEAF